MASFSWIMGSLLIAYLTYAYLHPRTHGQHDVGPRVINDQEVARALLTRSDLRSRSGPNRRLKTTFGIDNAFTTSDWDRYKDFLSDVKYRLRMSDSDWQRCSGTAANYLGQLTAKIEKSKASSLESLVQIFVFQTVLNKFFSHIQNPSEKEIEIITSTINTLWVASKSCNNADKPKWLPMKEALLSKLAGVFKTPTLNREGDIHNPLNIILPAYETLWRVVLRCFLEVRFRAPTAIGTHSQEILQRFAKDPTKENFEDRSLSELEVSVKDVVNEALRLYPPTRRIYRQDGARTLCKVDIEAMQRDETHWGPDSTVFNPGRMKHKSEEAVWMPFGKWRFSCPAESVFAPMMIGILVGVLVNGIDERFELSQVSSLTTLPLSLLTPTNLTILTIIITMTTTPLLPHTPTLHLTPLTTTDDIPHLTPLWYTCFSTPFLARLFPNTPALYKWWERANTLDHSSSTHVYLVVKDISPEGQNRIVGYAKWSLFREGVECRLGERFPPWCEESDGERCERFFGTEARERERVLGCPPSPHFYLDTLCVHPSYRRLGIAAQLTNWGCELADKEGMRAYVDASDMGRPVYVKCGFRGLKSFMVKVSDEEGEEEFSCMGFLREPRALVGKQEGTGGGDDEGDIGGSEEVK
ncbi:hypothetical protein G7Y89_g8538 [Cudoniella acicularis]|uniref:N-acetyltransferase domain-containing protein n=1 Tax=Cudoniella acicularis TaxID=354080 RepID=A0A8H4RK28_9HELO|nr:hypothetical protein G7Y89_g8538 [Cudoniella acicularis]